MLIALEMQAKKFVAIIFSDGISIPLLLKLRSLVEPEENLIW
jgi:hypothetical protein